MEKHIAYFTLWGTGSLTVDVYSTSRWYAGSKIMRDSALVPVVVPLRGPEKNHSDISKVCYPMHKNNRQMSLKVKVDLC